MDRRERERILRQGVVLPETPRRRRELAALREDLTEQLIDRHNRYYPVEARLPMDPRTGDYVLVNGRPYRRQPLDVSWILERFPARS